LEYALHDSVERTVDSIFCARAAEVWEKPVNDGRLFKRTAADALRTRAPVNAGVLCNCAGLFHEVLFWAPVETPEGRKMYRMTVSALRERLRAAPTREHSATGP